MKRYFKFRKDFRCNWDDILGAYDTAKLKKHVVENEYDSIKKVNWYFTEEYCDVFLFESEGITQKYFDDLNETLNGLAYFVKKEDEFDTIEELCDGFIFKDTHTNELHFLDSNSGISLLGASLFKETLRGFIETDKGLIYVAKMNEKGELELL